LTVHRRQLRTILKEISSNNLQENVKITGKYIMDNLTDLQTRFPSVITNVRGAGTFIAFDAVKGADARGAIVEAMKQRGVLIGACGERSVRLRPMLCFKPSHAATFLDNLEAVLAKA
jgi:4-aminobutyrate aminotransferase/(S)-3-amino-2-methylpropionate transaminase